MPTDDPTDPADDAPARGRRRVSGAQLLDAIEALPGRIREATGSSSDDPDDAPDGPLPPEVTFEPEPDPVPEPDAPVKDHPATAPPPAPDGPDQPSARRGGFPRRRR